MMRLLGKKYQSLSDESLLKEMKKGDQEAFNEIYSRYSKPLYQFFFVRMWKDAEKAEDFVHDILAKLIQNPEAFDLSRSFKTWIYSVANNMVKNEYKRQQVRANTHSFDQDQSAWKVGHEGLETEVNEQLFKEALEKELSLLDEKHREVFELRHVLGFSNKEIADLMEINEGTVKSRIFYAIKQLSSRLIEYKPTF